MNNAPYCQQGVLHLRDLGESLAAESTRLLHLGGWLICQKSQAFFPWEATGQVRCWREQAGLTSTGWAAQGAHQTKKACLGYRSFPWRHIPDSEDLGYINIWSRVPCCFPPPPPDGMGPPGPPPAPARDPEPPDPGTYGPTPTPTHLNSHPDTPAPPPPGQANPQPTINQP